MYTEVNLDEEVQLDNGVFVKPVATLEEKNGGKCQIIEDDHCYVLLLRQEDGSYKRTSWIFPEAFEVLKTLPSLV